MIIVDLSQVMISNILAQVGTHTDAIEPNLIRHTVLNMIRTIKNKYQPEYGELVLACDDRKYWRREYFPYYKGNRKADRQKSNINWTLLFETINTIKEELKTYFPYRVIQVEGAEADDIIGSLCFRFGNTDEKIIIMSGDKDFVQLHAFINVDQYDPVHKKKIKSDDPQLFLKKLILSGDRGDGIPNILSPDNSLVDGIKQKPLREKKIEEILNSDIESQPEDIRRNYFRNKTLIDLSYIPKQLQESIGEEYDRQSNKTRDNLFNYFVKNKLKLLMEHIGDF